VIPHLTSTSFLPTLDVPIEESSIFGKRRTKMLKFRKDYTAPAAQENRTSRRRKRNKIARKSRRINRRK